jgi:type IX secretion system PorP/SprF family membrane protein
MNRILLYILALLFPLQLFGQLFPISDHYVYNSMSINPAFAGCDDALSATVLYRKQWVGFEDAPKNQMLSVHTPVLKDRVGLGLLMEKNSIGIFNETNLMGNYAYRMPLRNGKLAMGLGFGLSFRSDAWNELEASDLSDEQLSSNQTSAAMPAFSLGIYYYSKKYFFGFSLPMFLSYEFDEKKNNYQINNSFSGYNYFFTGGYELNLSQDVKILPSVLIKYHPKNVLQIDYNTQVSLRDKMWLGLGYRNKNILVGMVQFQLNYQLKMGYYYDFNLGNISKYLSGSHEIILNYVFKYESRVMGPRKF